MMKTLVNSSTIPAELRRVPNWVCWRYEERNGRRTKVPINPHTGAYASVNDASTWSDFDTALEASQRFDGVGFVLTPEANIVAFDFDHCLREDGTWEPAVLELVRLLNSYTEVTPSGSGLRVLCFGRLPDGRKRRGNIEMYDTARFVTVTGCHLEGTPTAIEHRQQEIEQAYRRVFSVADTPPAPPAPPAPVDLSDAELLEKAFRAENGERFRMLWEGSDAGYPSASEADCALASMLLFWTGGDVARAERLFSQSPRGQREKWRERADYRERTMEAALSGKTDFYHSNGRKQYADPERLAPPQPAPRKAISLRELMAQEFAPLTYLVPDVLPEGGLSLLVGRPKVGKSWLALQIACALSAGGFALGLDTPLPQRRVLYCALEDGLRRLQRRITLLGTAYDPDAFHIVTELSPLDRGGADELRELIRDTGAQVVFVDVVARILPKRRRNDGVYQSDYDAFALLKDLAVAEGVTIVAVHHESKAPNEDPLMRVSGSTGLTGAVDAVLTLSKPRGELLGTLFVTGRDIEREGEYAVSFTAGKWYLEGDAKTVRMSEERKAILQAIEALGGKATPKQIADYLEKNSSTTRVLLAKMKAAGELRTDGTHYYINPVNTVNAVNADDCKTSTEQDSINVNEQQAFTPFTVFTPFTPFTPFTVSVTEEIQDTPVSEGSDIPDYRTAIIPLRDGAGAWCEVCVGSTLHVPTRNGLWRCVDCGTVRRLPTDG